eukprot:scaffold1282_cov251-Pinguiococcus_pyrenoidosus.AAC.29
MCRFPRRTSSRTPTTRRTRSWAWRRMPGRPSSARAHPTPSWIGCARTERRICSTLSGDGNPGKRAPHRDLPAPLEGGKKRRREKETHRKSHTHAHTNTH